jgi:hypothetical protein
MMGATDPAFNRDHAAAVSSRHVRMAEARNDRCACRKSNPNILVMQPAQDWKAKNTPLPL